MTKTKEKLLLIDGNSIAFRAFYALYNSLERFVNQDGLHTNAIYGFKTMLDFILEKEKPTHVLVAFDAGKKTFRTEKYEEYKGGRSKTPTELSEQFPYLRELLTAYGIKSYELANYEADDIIGTLASQASEQGMAVTVVSGDRDLTQLASDQVTVAITKKGVSEVEEFTPAYIAEKYEITPEQIIDMKGLVGDSSDNYPGVTKIGEKTAIKLLKQYGTIEGIYENITDMKKSKMKENLIAEKEIAFMCKDLATILKDAPITMTVADTTWSGTDYEALVKFYQQMNFKRFLGQLATEQPETTDQQTALNVVSVNAENVADLKIESTNNVSFYLEIDGANYHYAPLVGFSFQIGDTYYVSRDVELLKEDPFRALLENEQINIDLCDLKRTYVGLQRVGITLQSADFDLLLVSYLLNNRDNSDDLGVLAQQNDYYDLATDEKVYGKGAKRAIPTDDQVLYQHLAAKTKAITSLKEKLMTELQENQQEELYFTIERPLSLVLAEMEINGMAIDPATLETMKSRFTERLSEIEQAIYQEAGEEFNINSPKQLGVVLFEKLSLPVIKKTKTGYSTAVSVLEKLRGMSLIIDNILEYRQLSKLQSTYIEGLLKVISPVDGKIHTRYTQTLTATGRLSSVEPNLQNIPVRLKEGRQIRQAFVAEQPNHKIYTSDYSQIELRVLAHVSGDKNMQQAFMDNDDIHTNTAMKIFGISDPEQIDSNMRRQAKAVNFGIVYGISDYGLSQNLGITRKQAKAFIEAYLENFPGVQQYMEDVVTEAKEKGYVETIFKRRRYLPDIKSKNFNLRSFAERTAMNTPIQGSAADIIKVAMINMQKALKERGLQSKMILQVHDELLFDAPADEITILEELVPQIMDEAVRLSVPLKVDSSYGATWYDAK
ncbi:DNA polymerase I [Ligilactobacillus ceti]|uniref:DNA polymerase I n=1 Tax=Ligilactobacillus ceti DSM 22408 TaxID=1122146 RepID=A0A0R2KPD7_9LACO|nr:DNA polymerase I [Ligilactobacillus ceti]KRN88522.1 dna polymerase i [Ligilactobacillus ceti DSM 22408]